MKKGLAGVSVAREVGSIPYVQDSVVPGLNNQPYTGAADAVRPLQRDVLGLEARSVSTVCE